MKKLEKDQIEALIDKAISMMDYSYVPYSHFHVGAALLAQNGNVYGGCNISRIVAMSFCEPRSCS